MESKYGFDKDRLAGDLKGHATERESIAYDPDLIVSMGDLMPPCQEAGRKWRALGMHWDRVWHSRRSLKLRFHGVY